MNRRDVSLRVFYALLMLTLLAGAFVACGGQTCDQTARTTCDQKASICTNDKCGDKVGTDFTTCFEVLCVPALCECLDAVGCAWQETSCDDM